VSQLRFGKEHAVAIAPAWRNLRPLIPPVERLSVFFADVLAYSTGEGGLAVAILMKADLKASC
jgi:hypothetical protein